jgi:hypothetical protein
MSWRDTIVIHPEADKFPLLEKSELKQLADDIKKNGLRMPVVMLAQGKHKPTLLEGRNRLDAMVLAVIDFLKKTAASNPNIASHSAATLKWHWPTLPASTCIVVI